MLVPDLRSWRQISRTSSVPGRPRANANTSNANLLVRPFIASALGFTWGGQSSSHARRQGSRTLRKTHHGGTTAEISLCPVLPKWERRSHIQKVAVDQKSQI